MLSYSLRRRRIILAAGMCYFCDAQAKMQADDCLFSQATSNASAQGCTGDTLNLRSQPQVRFVIEEVSARTTEIELRGCQEAPFEVVSLRTPANRFRINYPIARNVGDDSYIAPITHELCHVQQIRSAGGILQLRQTVQNSSARIELGADFLTGVLYKKYLEKVGAGGQQRNLRQFQHSLDLLGSYRSDEGSHGGPVHRIHAFRRGFFFQEFQRPLPELHDYFQREIYGNII
ncbi:hypothetical protein [Falsiroseomonas sp. E2-1-a20]|uniref:hypothetical protein n=1 Tax=Falsiroseomonas sp. E2-1-a20 TaxID=3239300 RepID=UPI003F3D8FB9